MEKTLTIQSVAREMLGQLHTIPNSSNLYNCKDEMIAEVFESGYIPILAAAPEMLEALESAKAWLEEYYENSGDTEGIATLDRIDKAILRAEGK